jgi:uracil-DNA glycosylase
MSAPRSLPLLEQIPLCRACEAHLPHGPRPVVQAGPAARLLIVGQAPGKRVHDSGIPWNDPSGEQLRDWLQIGTEEFYDPCRVALMPMGFCYPGKGSSGDLPPRPECAPLWHARLLEAMPELRLALLIGRYAQAYYLGPRQKSSLTETVAHYAEYLPRYFPLPHPSPRNRFWQSKNPWFVRDVLPELRRRVKSALGE